MHPSPPTRRDETRDSPSPLRRARGWAFELSCNKMGLPQSTFRGSGRFRVVEWLGGGATGEVFQAVDVGSEARIALKALRDASPELLRLFKREFRAMQDIRHENLASLGELF